MLKQFEELKIFIEDYLSYLRESKQVRKQIRIHYKDDLHKFILTFLYGVSCWFLFFIGGKIIVHFDFVNLGIISIMFALLYSFVIFTPLSLIFLLRYSTNVRIAQKVFENEWRANKIIKKLQTTRDRDRIQHFQRLLRKFDYNFYYMIWDYFKGYGKRIKTYSIILTECYSRFDTVLNMVCINVEINSNKAREMLSDFSKYMDEIRSKILVPLIQDKLQIHDINIFLQRWDKYFEDHYKNEYRDSLKYLEKYIEKMRKRYRDRYLKGIKIFDKVVEILILVFIALVVYYFSGIKIL